MVAIKMYFLIHLQSVFLSLRLQLVPPVITVIAFFISFLSVDLTFSDLLGYFLVASCQKGVQMSF